MKTSLILASLLAISASASAQVGVSINIGEPGFYGRIVLGNVAPPPVVYAQPVIVERPARYVETAPIYLRVPPGHQKHWEKHCREYNACGQRVLFVREDWYTNEYAPRYRQEHGRGDDRRRDYDDRDQGRGDRDHDHDDHDKGHGHGHDRDHDRD
jgi:hypothetical protein